MTKFTLPIVIVLLGVVVFVLHAYALDNFLYWHLPWLDVVMHFLGGILVSLFGFWAAKRYIDRHTELSKTTLLFNTLLFVFIISLLWESFELVFEFVEIEDQTQYAVDTLIDFLMSTIGAFFTFYLIHITYLSKKQSLHE